MSSAQPTPKRAQIQAAVLEATEALLEEGASYAELNIERIATRAGISRTAFYFYFRDKRELLMRLTEHVSERFYRQADLWFSGNGDPAGGVREALTNLAALYREHGVLLRAIVEVSTYDEEVAAFWRAVMDRFVQAAERRIAAEQEAGRAAAGPPRATAFARCWMLERTFYEYLEQGRPLSEDELIDALVDIWVRTDYART